MDDIEKIILTYYTPVERKYIAGKRLDLRETRQLISLGYDVPSSSAVDSVYNAVLHNNAVVARRIWSGRITVAFNAAIVADSPLLQEIIQLGGRPDKRTDECIGYSCNPRKFRHYITDPQEVMTHAAHAGNIDCMFMMPKPAYSHTRLYQDSFQPKGRPQIAIHLGGYPAYKDWLVSCIHGMNAKCLVRAIAYGSGYTANAMVKSLQGCRTVTLILAFLVHPGSARDMVKFSHHHSIHKLANIMRITPQEMFDAAARIQDVKKMTAIHKRYKIQHQAVYDAAARFGQLEVVKFCKPFCTHDRARALAKRFGHREVYNYINHWRL